MPTDPVEEWRRLSALYNEMGDIEIQELADQINDLTPTAQDVLRNELKKRRISTEANDPVVHWHQEHGTAADTDLDVSEEGRVLGLHMESRTAPLRVSGGGCCTK